MRKDCNYRFCDKTRFVQHTARHERLDTLCGNEFEGFRGVTCSREPCEFNINNLKGKFLLKYNLITFIIQLVTLAVQVLRTLRWRDMPNQLEMASLCEFNHKFLYCWLSICIFQQFVVQYNHKSINATWLDTTFYVVLCDFIEIERKKIHNKSRLFSLKCAK